MSSLIRSSAGVGIDVKLINAVPLVVFTGTVHKSQLLHHHFFFLHEHFINLLLYNLCTPSLKKQTEQVLLLPLVMASSISSSQVKWFLFFHRNHMTVSWN